MLLQDVNKRCPSINNNTNNTNENFLLRFTESATVVEGNYLYITTKEGLYEDIWTNAKVSINATNETCTPNLGATDTKTKQFCTGANTPTDNCKKSDGDLTFVKSVLTCTDCYLGMSANFFTEFNWN